MVRKTSPSVSKSPGCRPLNEMYKWAVATQPSRWSQVEQRFLSAMWEFDQNLASGLANQGDNQNGKGDFFTDLIALLLENCSGKELHGRGSIPGLIFPNNYLDTSYPEVGTVEILIETKAAGAPKSGRNPRQKNPQGRPGSADLPKRIKEAIFKTIDLKAEWARVDGQGGGPTSDLLTWLHRSKPHCYLFLAVRAVDEKDGDKIVEIAQAAQQMMDKVGLVAYQPNLAGNGYQACKVGTPLELDRALSWACTALRALP
jgi:hypothetical protein